MHDFPPPNLETFDHWPSWLNAKGHVDRSACFELKVSDIRRLAGCIPMTKGSRGQQYRAKGRQRFDVPDLPNEQRARNVHGRLTTGSWDLSAYQMNALARLQFPRRLGGDWRTGRAPAMRPRKSQGGGGMTLKQGGYGPGSYAYESNNASPPGDDPAVSRCLDAGLDANPNCGASREKKFGIDIDWLQPLVMEKWTHNSVSGVQYFLICPGPTDHQTTMKHQTKRSTVNRKGLKGMTGTTSNAGDGSRGAHGKGWVCGQRVYKLFWVLGREEEHRDALLAEQWIAQLTSRQLAQQSAQASALIDRYGPIMGDDRLLRCRRCLRLRYGQSPEVLRKARRLKQRQQTGRGPGREPSRACAADTR